MEYLFDKEKNDVLKKERNISFEELIELIEGEAQSRIYPHPNKNKYPEQSMIEVYVNVYVWLIPCIIKSDKVILKTAYPSRKATKKLLER